jgi:hypothetical protein
MVRRVSWLVLACVLAACGADDPDFELRFRDLPEETTVLDMFGSRPGMARLYYMEASSNVDRTVRLQARFSGTAPEGMTVRMLRGELLPHGSAKPVLQVLLPKVTGSVKGTLVIFSDERPGWEQRYEFAGTVEDRPLEGRYLKVEPPGVDFGDLRPGERKEFAFTLLGSGTEAVMIHGVMTRDDEHIVLARGSAGVLVPGGTRRVAGVFTAPKGAGPFQAVIDVRTNAINFRERVTLMLRCKVVPDYAPHPDKLGPVAHFPAQQLEFPVTVRGREGTEPFTVGKITGHDRYFSVVRKGSEEAAREQTVVFRLKPDAPTDATAVQQFGIRIRLEPFGAEIVWPVTITLNPPIYAVPPRLHFGTLPSGQQRQLEVRLAAVAGREFEVTRATTERGLFKAEVRHAPGLSWRIVVTIPKRSARGLLQDRVVIETDDPDVPRLVVEVKAEIR